MIKSKISASAFSVLTIFSFPVTAVRPSVPNLPLAAGLLLLMGSVVLLWAARKSRSAFDERCFTALAEQVGGVIIEWDFPRQRLRALSPDYFVQLFGWSLETVDPMTELLERQLVHPDDTDAFLQALGHMRCGKPLPSVKFRLRDAYNCYHWVSMTVSEARKQNGKPVRSIGILMDIDTQEREIKLLYRQANCDGLTGLYNKAAMERLISQLLSAPCKPCQHALIFMDIDDFKRLNDTFGHLYGDQVLIKISDCIRTFFRSSDIAGRFGGDEFVILLRDIPSASFVESKAHRFLKKLELSFAQEPPERRASLSIGIAICAKDGRTYADLYHNADLALYQAKRTGKNRCVLYAPSCQEDHGEEAPR